MKNIRIQKKNSQYSHQAKQHLHEKASSSDKDILKIGEQLKKQSNDKNHLREELGAYLFRNIMEILDHQEQNLDLSMSVDDLGIDSLSAMQIIKKAEEDLSVEISLDVILQGGKLIDVVDNIITQLA